MSDPLELISGYLDHDLSDAEVMELESWILADRDNALLFARRATMHSQIRDALAGEVLLQLSQLRSPELFEPIEGADDFETQDIVPGSMSDAMIMQALVESDSVDEPAPLVLQRSASPIAESPSSNSNFFRSQTFVRAGSIAAGILLCIGLGAWFIAARPVATLTAGVGSVWGLGEKTPLLGETLSPGRSLRLNGGFAELTYPSGAKVVVEGPATFVLNSRSLVTLVRGRLTALIPEPAHGFTVSTPAGKIVDLGTEFGVTVSSDSDVQTHVFQGHIIVGPRSDLGIAPVTVAAGQDAEVATANIVAEPTSPSVQPYVRDIHQVVGRFPTHGTAQGLRLGDADPYWRLTSVPNQPQWISKPAVCTTPLGFYLPNDSASCWVSTAAKLIDVDAGLYTFNTTFDLTGFNPSLAHLHLNLSADDEVAEVRLNGFTVSRTEKRSQWYRAMHPLEIDKGFVPGINRLEIVVRNDTFSKVALRAELEGTALRNLDPQ